MARSSSGIRPDRAGRATCCTTLGVPVSGKCCALGEGRPTRYASGSSVGRRAAGWRPLLAFRLSGDRSASELRDELAQGGEHPLVAFAEKRGEDVLADLVAPEMVAAVAAGEAGGVEVDPMGLHPTCYPVPARANPGSPQVETALQAVESDSAEGGKIKGRDGAGRSIDDVESHIRKYTEAG
jgi:hypothetical protein